MKDALNKFRRKSTQSEENSRDEEGGTYKTYKTCKIRGFPAGRDLLGGCWGRGGGPCNTSQRSLSCLHASGEFCSSLLLSDEQGDEITHLKST